MSQALLWGGFPPWIGALTPTPHPVGILVTTGTFLVTWRAWEASEDFKRWTQATVKAAKPHHHFFRQSLITGNLRAERCPEPLLPPPLFRQLSQFLSGINGSPLVPSHAAHALSPREVRNPRGCVAREVTGTQAPSLCSYLSATHEDSVAQALENLRSGSQSSPRNQP